MRLMLACLLSLGAASPARAFLGSRPEAALLWVPAENFSDWAALERLMSSHGDLRLTVGATPAQLTPESARLLAPLVAKGRLELALRLVGDPLLPLIAEHPQAPRPDDIPSRLAIEREEFRVTCGTAPAGFVPGAGAVTPALFAGIKAMGPTWVAVGEYAGAGPWAVDASLALVPFRAVRAPERELTPEDIAVSGTDAGARVIDEASGLVSAGAFLKLLPRLAEQDPGVDWSTVSELVKKKREASLSASSVTAWPPWTPLDAWTASAGSRRAWRLYGQAALALERYQNSGSADLKALESAAESLYAAQAGSFYRELPSPQSEDSFKKFRSLLITAHRRIRATPPEDLFSAPAGAPRGGAKPPAAEETPTDVHFSQGDGWLSFENPVGSAARAPEETPGADAGPWTIERLRVNWGGENLTLIYRMRALDSGAADAPTPAQAPIGRLMLETYIDLNGVSGAGSSSLLFDRAVFIQARDNWEYAVALSAWGAFLYRSNPMGAPAQAASLEMSVDAAQREIRVTVPSSMLRGNPLRWGFVVAAGAADPATTSKPPVRPLKPAQGPTILGLLAPLEQQRTLALASETTRPRLSALRARVQPSQ